MNPRPSETVTQAMIFAAGLGTRFKPWTDHHPKALALVNGKSLLQRNIEYLQQYGIRDVIVNIHHFGEQILEEVLIHKGWGSRIRISDETDEVLETGGGLLKAQPLFNPGHLFITCNADILTDLDIHKLIAFHHETESLISFGVTNRKTSRNFLFDRESRLCGWINHQTGEKIISRASDHLVEKAYSCVVVFDDTVFELTRQRGKFSLTEMYLDLARDHKISGYEHSGDRWVDVGKTDSIKKAEALFP